MPAKPGPLRPHEQRTSYARRPALQPPPGDPSIGDSFLLVTEGEVTEPAYFKNLRQLLKIGPLTIFHPPCTHALGLVEAAISERDNRAKAAASGRRCPEFEDYDHIWVLFDTDTAATEHQLEPALNLARKENIHIGSSTPCVEYWLLLHFEFTTRTLLNSREASEAISRAWTQPYAKDHKSFPKLWEALKPNIPHAVNRASEVRAHHLAVASEFPPNPATELDLLVRALNASVRPELRIR